MGRDIVHVYVWGVGWGGKWGIASACVCERDRQVSVGLKMLLID